VTPEANQFLDQQLLLKQLVFTAITRLGSWGCLWIVCGRVLLALLGFGRVTVHVVCACPTQTSSASALVEGRGFELVSGIRLSIPDRNKRNGLFPQIARKLRISLTEKGPDILQLGKEPLLLNRRFDPHALAGQCQPGDVIGLWCPLFRLNFLSALLTSVHEAHLLKIF